MFDAAKTTQIAAYMLEKRDGKMKVLKLMKLLYLAERTYFDKHNSPMTGDCMVSMDHGPVLSKTLDLINGFEKSDYWDQYISDRAQHYVQLIPDHAPTSTLSKSEIDTLNAVCDEFGGMTEFEIRDYTHDNCPEWQDPMGTSVPIDPSRLLSKLGKTDDEIAEILEVQREQDDLSRIFSSL